MSSLAVFLGLLTGAVMSVAISCVWSVLLIPARVQSVMHAASPKLLTWAICLGLFLSTLHDMLGFSFSLPISFGSAALLFSGMFVGMLSAALEEILEVAPVIMRRFRLGNVSTGVRFVMMLGKGIGATLAALAVTL